MREKCVRHWPTTQNIRKCLLSIHIQIWVLLTLIQYFIAELSSCQVFRCSPSHHVDQETCTEIRKRSISSARLGASKPPHFHKTEESHVLIAWPPNSRLRTSPTHLPSLMVALSLDYHVIWLGEASWWSNALHTRSIHLKHWIFLSQASSRSRRFHEFFFVHAGTIKIFSIQHSFSCASSHICDFAWYFPVTKITEIHSYRPIWMKMSLVNRQRSAWVIKQNKRCVVVSKSVSVS